MKNNNMKWSSWALIMVFLAFTLGSCSQNATENNNDDQQEASSAEVATGVQTVSGEVLDMSCFLDHGAMGESHRKCAQGCLDRGLPAGIIDENGQVYLLLEDHDVSDAYKEVVQHAADNVDITGEVVNNNGILSLKVQDVTVKG